jgi:hypothetical protein
MIFCNKINRILCWWSEFSDILKTFPVSLKQQIEHEYQTQNFEFNFMFTFYVLQLTERDFSQRQAYIAPEYDTAVRGHLQLPFRNFTWKWFLLQVK